MFFSGFLLVLLAVCQLAGSSPLPSSALGHGLGPSEHSSVAEPGTGAIPSCENFRNGIGCRDLPEPSTLVDISMDKRIECPNPGGCQDLVPPPDSGIIVHIGKRDAIGIKPCPLGSSGDDCDGLHHRPMGPDSSSSDDVSDKRAVELRPCALGSFGEDCDGPHLKPSGLHDDNEINVRSINKAVLQPLIARTCPFSDPFCEPCPNGAPFCGLGPHGWKE